MQLRAAATLAVASSLTFVPAAAAEPSVPTVRTEGYAQTLFEGPVRTEGRAIRAASDTQDRPCDGTNNGANPAPGATATGATVDAMSIAGLDFDGQWYDGFDDYFVKRFGPDAEDEDRFAYWGILVDRVFTPVGGCQFQVADGQEVMWAADAFNSRPFLDLSVPGQAGPLATVAPGAPLTVRAGQVESSGELEPGETGPAAGATVAPVATAASGFQTVLVTDPAARPAGADGTVALTWSIPGWKRIKATVPDGDGDGFEDAVRSNRIDVCVSAAGLDGCGPPPSDTLVRSIDDTPAPEPSPSPAPSPTPEPSPTAEPGPGPGPSLPIEPGPVPATPSPVRVSGPRVTLGARSRGRVRVAWTVDDPGPGVLGWRMASATLPGRDWRTRAAGATGVQQADLALPPGRTSALRFTLLDAAGRATTTRVGRVTVPLDDRARAVRRSGRWRAASSRTAWWGTVSVGRPGARAAVRLAAGRPHLELARGGRGIVAVTAGGRTQRFRVEPRTTRVTAAKRARAGAVRVRVLRGTVRFDGVAVVP